MTSQGLYDVPINYALCHGVYVNSAGRAQKIPARELGVFNINGNTRIRDITDGTTSTFAIGEAAMSPLILTPKFTICRGQLPASLPHLAVPGTGPRSWQHRRPSVCGGCRPQPVWVQVLVNDQFVNSTNNSVAAPICADGRQQRCTDGATQQEPCDRHLCGFGRSSPERHRSSRFVTSAPTRCTSTWASRTGGPPVSSLSLTGVARECQQWPAQPGARWGLRIPRSSSLSNFPQRRPSERGPLPVCCGRGSVQFINDSIDMSIYTSLSTACKVAKRCPALSANRKRSALRFKFS